MPIRVPPPAVEPPAHLSAASRAWFLGVATTYDLEPHHHRLLTLAAEAWDRGEAARRAIDEAGMVFRDRFGAPRARPEVAIERDARVAFARLVRELDLDMEPPSAERRPPAIRSNRR